MYIVYELNTGNFNHSYKVKYLFLIPEGINSFFIKKKSKK